MHPLSMVKVKVLIRNLVISQELFYWTQVTINNFGALPISIPYGSPAELIISCVVVLLNSSEMEQDLHTNTSKYGVWAYKLPMGVLQEIILMIDHIEIISWDIQLLQKLFYTGIWIVLLLSIDTIMFGFMDIIIVSP